MDSGTEIWLSDLEAESLGPANRVLPGHLPHVKFVSKHLIEVVRPSSLSIEVVIILLGKEPPTIFIFVRLILVSVIAHPNVKVEVAKADSELIFPLDTRV
jgi:hypothetical protein